MILFFILTICFVGWYLSKPYLITIKNIPIRTAFFIFLSTYISVIIIFITTCLLSLITSEVLMKSVYLYWIALLILAIRKRRYIASEVYSFLKYISKLPFFYITVLIFISSILYLFFANFVTIHDQKLFVSSAYIDFHWHARLIQNFVYGDNFFPQNESLAGIYHVYHYFWSLIPAIFEVLGLNLAQALSLYATLFFTAIILAAGGLIKEIYNRKILWILLPVFILSHGSFKFFDYIHQITIQHKTISDIFSQFPYFIDYNMNGSFGYNGNMFNMYYFIQEPQLIFACLALLLFLYVLLHIESFSKKFLLGLSILLGLFLQWHLCVSMMFIIIGMSYMVIWTIIYRKKPSHLLIFIIPYTVLLFIYSFVLKNYALHDPFFNAEILKSFPQFNASFATMPPSYSLSFMNGVNYYFYAFGFRSIIYLLGFIYAYITHKKFFYLLLSCLPIFILINTVQLSPLSIYDNHKWLKPFLLIMDVVCLGLFLSLIQDTAKKSIKIILSICLILSMISGIIVFLAYMVQLPTVEYASFKNKVFQYAKKTPPKSVFITDEPKLILLAGRKTYIADYLGGDLGINIEPRQNVLNEIKNNTNQNEICHYLAKKAPIITHVYMKEKNLLFSCVE